MFSGKKEYTILRKEFLEVAKTQINSMTLRELIITYQSAINSLRASDCIENIEDLIRILEKRGVIRWNQITPLKHIAKSYFYDTTIVDRICSYENWLKEYTPPYPPRTNLYQVQKGECYLRETNTNNLCSCSCFNANIHSHSRYNFPYTSLPIVTNNDDTNSYNNSKVLTNLQNGFTWTEISSVNNDNSNSNRNSDTKKIKDSKIPVFFECSNIPRNERQNVTSDIPLPLDLISENERNDEALSQTYSSMEDLNKSDKNPPDIPLLLTSRSVEPRTNVCSLGSNASLKLRNSLKRSSSKDNIKILSNRLNKFIQKRFVKVLLFVVCFAIILSTILIAYDLSNKTVHYNLQPPAPSVREVYTDYPETSSNSHNEFSWQFRQNAYPPYVTRRKNEPLQTLTEKEEKFQNYGNTLQGFLLLQFFFIIGKAIIGITVFEAVSMQMGKFWQDVARRLNIRECDINNIDQQYRSFEEKSHATLKLFAKRTNLDYWQMTLKEALDKARRKDLMVLVEELASRRF